jgi:esterase/lipase superfamily enzyme
VSHIREFSSQDLWDNVRMTAKGKDPVLYVHGFFIDFEKGCRRATVFHENAKLDENFVWFSWPSDGNLFNYARDEVDLYWSVPDLAEIIIEMEKEFGKGRVNLVGHSLGARGLVLALYDLTSADPDVRVDNVVLLAPDMDFEIFRKLLPRIAKLARTITIYTSPTDRPLGLSAQLHGYARLGQSGNDVSRLAGVEVVDVGDLPGSSPSGHLYHLYDSTVGDDLDQLLNGGLSAASRRNLAQVSDNLWKFALPDQK